MSGRAFFRIGGYPIFGAIFILAVIVMTVVLIVIGLFVVALWQFKSL